MAKTTTWTCPICSADYPSQDARNRCWNSHCTDPASHNTHQRPHPGQRPAGPNR